ncbi:transmembrane amino acid transporter protein-domain-containing protein [Radiomyces spectabilis]|uniref:transmembrane amino acid transporter protein-domain-containing protein n=1 Tax=Radiomyces spectabilis TaxID=64574 RepID=UPI00221F26C4|nr:transmembrane amino acid transporter protein-domain-containing protein [Radiomyces spectabilis]KAI8376317.1 transmembrane amino acid transporter protein-domain-containing protein [Radiomyces spectabilis]
MSSIPNNRPTVQSNHQIESYLSARSKPTSEKEEIERHHQEDDRVSADCEKSFSEEQIEHVPEGTGSPSKALFMLLKVFVGTGVIFLPGSFVSGGLIFSICLMVFVACLCLVAFQLLVKVQRLMGGSYGDLAYALYGPWLRYCVQFFLCLSQMGFVASYLIFISENIGLAVQTLSNCYSPFEAKYYIWMVIAIVIPVTWTRKIVRLSWFAIIADVFILFGLICVLYFCSAQIAHNGPGPNIKNINPNDFALMIGTAVFSFEGVGMVVPIVEGMKEPEKFPRVLNIGMVIVAVIFILIGTIGYVAYGENTQASVVANLPRQPLSVTVQLLYAIAMILTCPCMLYPALTIIERGIYGPNRSGRTSLKYKWGKNFVRSMIAIVCAAVSFGVGADSLNKFVALVGSVACMPLCFIFPGMFHYKVANNRWKKTGDVILTIWGIGIMIYTLYVNINSWVHPAPSAPAPECIPVQQ